MVTKSRDAGVKKKRKVNVGKLNLNKETIKRLGGEELRKVRGGLHPSNTKGCKSK